MKAFRKAVKAGISPEEVAEGVFRAIRGERFYILTHPEFTPIVQARMEAIVRDRRHDPWQS